MSPPPTTVQFVLTGTMIQVEGLSLSAALCAGPDRGHPTAGVRGECVSCNGSGTGGTCHIFQLLHVSRCDAEMASGYIKRPGFISFISLTNTVRSQVCSRPSTVEGGKGES